MLRHLAAQALSRRAGWWTAAGLLVLNEARGLVVVAAVWRGVGGWHGIMRLGGWR